MDGTLLPGQQLRTLTTLTPGAWNEVFFTTPIPITANTIYVASNYSPAGYYTSTDGAFANPVINGPLTIIADSAAFDPSKANGVYIYSITEYPKHGS